MLKWLWQWLLKSVVGVKSKDKVLLVPVLGSGETYEQKWTKEQYIKSVAYMGENDVWITEIVNTIKILRDYADTVDNPEGLKCINVCIKQVKGLLIKPEIAKQALKDMNLGETNEYHLG